MFKVKVKEGIKEYCKDQIARYNFGMRSQANGTPEQQYTGILGQCTILDLLGKDLINGEDGCDDGEDLNFEGLSVDVKTMGRTKDVRPPFVLPRHADEAPRVLLTCHPIYPILTFNPTICTSISSRNTYIYN
jgi:hypothetical protein